VQALSERSQVSLLRFLESQEYRRLGSGCLHHSDVRVLSASNTHLAEMVEREEFRADLYFRLNVLVLTMPPLRERCGDVDLLARHFLDRLQRQYGGSRRVVHPQSLEWMRTYYWPGNTRELENLMHRAFLLADGRIIVVDPPNGSALDPDAVDNAVFDDILDSGLSFNDAKALAISRFERGYLSRIISESNGNVTLAAQRAGKERRALGKLLKKHDIDRDRFQRRSS
jgi:DNA-binding NtrC family response regulator